MVFASSIVGAYRYYGYHGHKLLAADGTFPNLPNHPSIHEEFDR